MNKEKIRECLRNLYEFDWIVKDNRHIRLNHGGYVSYGSILPIKTEREIYAIAHLMLRTYRDRQPLMIGRLIVPPDMSFKSQEELFEILNEEGGGGTIVRQV